MKYLDHDERFRELVREGMRQADAGELLDFDDVASKLRAKIAKDRAEHGRENPDSADAAGSLDLDHIYEHIAAGERVERILDVMSHLEDHPEMGKAGREAGTHELVVDKTDDIIAYRIVDDVIEVLRVVHGARLWPPLLKR